VFLKDNTSMNNLVFLNQVNKYSYESIYNVLDDSIFNKIKPFHTVVLKPNWVKESHFTKPNEWEYIITHPTVITAVLKKVVDRLDKGGRVIITDGPQTDSSFKKILERNPVSFWEEICDKKGIILEIIDLRDDEWTQKNGVIIKREKLKGDPRGNVEVNLNDELSEFFGKIKSQRGFYGADYNLSETNKAHDGINNLYRVSKSVIEADVFINLPKLKTHKKAGITCCLKNLVGINTYKNYLPHHSEGDVKEGGDQFPTSNVKSKIEGPFVAFVRNKLLQNTKVANFMGHFRKLGLWIFGKSENTIRSGNWYGNDTVWRMILDLNKTLFYANPDGSFRADNFINAKNYIGIVDGIIAGEGSGPGEPDPVNMNYLISGNNPVAIDCVCAKLMGFDYEKIPSLKNAFNIKHLKLVNFDYDMIDVMTDHNKKINIKNLPSSYIKNCKPHFGWVNHIEL
jgi:uncharacterized protein (DUF362 family)